MSKSKLLNEQITARFNQTTLWEIIKKIEFEYEFHSIANIFPLIDGQELEDLIADIKKNGLLQPIILYENKVLDGRNRYIACKKANITPRFKQYDKEISPLDYVIAENLHRRHLSSGQKAEIGLELLKIEEEKALKRQEKTQLNGRTEENKPKFKVSVPSSKDGTEQKSLKKETEKGEAIEITAKKLGIGHETLRTAKKVKEMNDPKINKKWEQAKKGKTTIKAVKMAIDKKTKPKIIPKLPEDKYDVIYADPPWQYNFTEAPNRTVEKEYPTMALKEICNIKIPSAKDCILFLWCTSPKLYPEGNEVIKSWGFTYKTSMVWVKDKIGMGYYARNRHELLLIATKGSPGVPEPSDRPDSVINAPRKEHSKKPENVYNLIEKMYPERKYLELFARNKRDGWKSWGNEL